MNAQPSSGEAMYEIQHMRLTDVADTELQQYKDLLFAAIEYLLTEKLKDPQSGELLRLEEQEVRQLVMSKFLSILTVLKELMNLLPESHVLGFFALLFSKIGKISRTSQVNLHDNSSQVQLFYIVAPDLDSRVGNILNMINTEFQKALDRQIDPARYFRKGDTIGVSEGDINAVKLKFEEMGVNANSELGMLNKVGFQIQVNLLANIGLRTFADLANCTIKFLNESLDGVGSGTIRALTIGLSALGMSMDETMRDENDLRITALAGEGLVNSGQAYWLLRNGLRLLSDISSLTETNLDKMLRGFFTDGLKELMRKYEIEFKPEPEA